MSTAGRYAHIVKLGEGTYGCVYQATEKATGRVIAFKRMTMSTEEEGVPGTAIREICLLKELKHSNIVSLYEVLFDAPKITLVFELCDCDMKQYLDKQCPNGRMNAETEVRPILKQMFAGLYYLHSRSVVHRDLKPQNVFFNIRQPKFLNLDGVWGASEAASEEGNSGSSNAASTGPSIMNAAPHQIIAKLGDFGLARVENIPVKKYSHEVVTLWYRSPDVIMGSALYSFPVDMWSMGAIFFEMVTGRVLFGARNEDDQMLRVFRLLGSPTKETWHSMRTYPGTGERLERVAAFLAAQRQDERVRRQRLAQAAAANNSRSRNGSGVNQQPASRTQPTTGFSFTEFCLEREDEATLRDNANSARTAANSLRLPAELWFPNALFDEYMTVSEFRHAVGDDGVDLLRRCLQYEPSMRITAGEALVHPFLKKVKTPSMSYLDQLMTQMQQKFMSEGL